MSSSPYSLIQSTHLKNSTEASMATDIQDCKDLLEHTIKQNFNSNDTKIIYPEPTKIFGNSKVALHGQSFSGHATTIYMSRLKLPEELQFFVRLAEKGPGHTESYDGSRYKFIKGE